MSYIIISHDCEQDSEDCTTTGPFADQQEAADYIAAHNLDIPIDGGYAFAMIIGPEDLEAPGDTACGDEDCEFCGVSA